MRWKSVLCEVMRDWESSPQWQTCCGSWKPCQGKVCEGGLEEKKLASKGGWLSAFPLPALLTSWFSCQELKCQGVRGSHTRWLQGEAQRAGALPPLFTHGHPFTLCIQSRCQPQLVTPHQLHHPLTLRGQDSARTHRSLSNSKLVLS